ncbi:hypothetical protein DMP23_17640 [Amycolatopsis sp. A1MSW2902]|uniref:hypothetical protein n=1 Tax=Amycolatopsis sp. A1MSW2902 TaxID=687413 RepID=UPI00307FA54A
MGGGMSPTSHESASGGASPSSWREPRPALFVRGGTAYVTDPGKKEVHAVDLGTGEKTATGTLPGVPNELSGVVAES